MIHLLLSLFTKRGAGDSSSKPGRTHSSMSARCCNLQDFIVSAARGWISNPFYFYYQFVSYDFSSNIKPQTFKIFGWGSGMEHRTLVQRTVKMYVILKCPNELGAQL